MSTETLAEVYRRYLQCLNERRWDDLGEFVCDDAIHNRRPLGLSGIGQCWKQTLRQYRTCSSSPN
jgi:predicted ester cyclase